MQENFSPPESTVVVTGLGAFTAAGPGIAPLWSNVCRGVSPAQHFQPNEKKTGYVVCRAPDPENAGPELSRVRHMDRSVQFAAAAAGEAWRDAGLQSAEIPEGRSAIFAGTSRGPLGTILEAQAHLEEGHQIRPSVATNSTITCLSGVLSNIFAIDGTALTVSAACASGAAAIALAAQQIRSGAADIVLTGGAEAPLHEIVLAQLQSAGVLGSNPEPALACRPFDSSRNGTVLGEGAAFLVLESLGSARRRGARIYGQLAGWALNSEPAQRTGISDHCDGLQRTMRGAVGMAGIDFEELDYINAHGTGTPLNDRAESQAIARCNAGARHVRTSSTKAVVGHCMGAGSAIEAVISVLALEHQIVPPSANCFEQADDCPIDLVLGAALSCPVRSVLTNSLGFWGNHASLVFGRQTSR